MEEKTKHGKDSCKYGSTLKAKMKADHLRCTTRTSLEAKPLILLGSRSAYLAMKCAAITKLAGSILLLLSQLLLLRAVGSRSILAC